MSTKTNTSTSNAYNANGMDAYNGLIPNFAKTTNALMTSPLNNSFFQNQLAQSQKSASQVNQRNMSNATSNNRAGGGLLSGAGGFLSAQQNNAMLSGSANQSGAFNSSLNSALQNRNFALSSAEGFNPLQTGSNTTQSKSGLGTWLPQVAGAALGAATGGLSQMGGGAASQIAQAANTSNNPWSTTNPSGTSMIPQQAPSAWSF